MQWESATKYTVNVGNPKKKMKNFLDDIFMVFMGSMTALDKFFEEINKVQSKIKFTMTLNTPNIVS